MIDPTEEDLVELVERKMECLVNIAPSKCLVDMQMVYAGDRGTTEERALLYKWRCEKPMEFVKEMNSLERDFKRSIAALAKGSAEKRLPTEEKSRGKKEETKEDGGEEKSLELVENLLREWGEGHGG